MNSDKKSDSPAQQGAVQTQPRVQESDQIADQPNYWSHSNEQTPKATERQPISYYLSQFKHWLGIDSQ